MSSAPLPIVIKCPESLVRRVRYVFDTLFMAKGLPVAYVDYPPVSGPWVLYAPTFEADLLDGGCVPIRHMSSEWEGMEAGRMPAWQDVGPASGAVDVPEQIELDLVASAFYFLASCSERGGYSAGSRGLYRDSIFARAQVPADIVDRYLHLLWSGIEAACSRTARSMWAERPWPGEAGYAIVLSHDVDFIPVGTTDTLKQGAKSVLRHLVKERDLGDAWRAARGFLEGLREKRDIYGCLPQILEQERQMGVRSSFQVAVGHRHPADVNYFIEDPYVQRYLRQILDAGFEVNLHGSYRSTENVEWYVAEVETLRRHLGTPLGSRQHFLSFHYDALFTAQEKAGIRYDMSMGFPDRIGPRAGFSYPYYPYCLAEDRPYDVVEISLFLMDVTLRGYMGLRGEEAWEAMRAELDAVRGKRGCASVVWHPIVFGGGRDPGFDTLYWRLVRHVKDTGGLPTDGRTIDRFWRDRAREYASFGGESANGVGA